MGLRAKLFGTTQDAALLWRSADVIVARARAEVVARTLLVGGKLVALVDDAVANSARLAAALENRKRAIPAKGLLFVSSALDGAFAGSPPSPTGDGSENIADIVYAVATDKRGIIDERRAAAQAATRDRVRAASAATQAAAAATAMPGDLEDLGGGSSSAFVDDTAIPDAAELARLRAEVEKRKAEMTKSMMAARDTANSLAEQAKAARGKGATDEAAQLDKRADAERARMHALLGELATLETELAELERVRKNVGDIPKARPSARPSGADPVDDVRPPPAPSIDDALRDLKSRAGGPNATGTKSTPKPSGGSGSKGKPASTVDDELAALKKKMQSNPKQKK
jgi:hypothetical protein